MTTPVTSSAPTSAEAPETKPKDIAGAARQFEALLLSQLLKAACDPGAMTGGDPDAGARTAIEMAQEQFATALASQGGLGLARMVTESAQLAGPKS